MLAKLLDTLLDEKSNCYSIMTEMSLRDYLLLTNESYDQQGKLEGQRDKLKTTSGVRIRRRMIDDFKNKAILPPVVLGIVIDKARFDNIKKISTKEEVEELINTVSTADISIIDGMQRTAVYKETAETTNDYIIRVEYWISTNTESLTYRMLVLNTGQAPWNLRRQVEVVYKPLLNEIEQFFFKNYSELIGKVVFYDIDDNGARTNAGEFHKNHIMELYLSFGLRKEKINTANLLAEDFSRLDMIEAMANDNFFIDFVIVLGLLSKLDIAISENLIISENENFKISIGRNLFDGMPAKVGFVVACSQSIFGRLGSERTADDQISKIVLIEKRINSIINKIVNLEEKDQSSFFALAILNERIENAPTNKIGDWQRAFYLEAFRLLVNEDISDSLEPIWRAY